MFHANAWGYPYLAAMIGSKLVFPGPYLDPESLLDDFVQEGVTWTAGVPTIWLGMLQMLDATPDKWDLSKMKGMLVGGSAVPRSMIAGYKERHGLSVVQGWGMTETSPVASVTDFTGDLRSADQDTKFDYVAMAGMPLPLVELRVMAEGNELPWDGESMGELEVRGPWVASAYYDDDELKDRWTSDGWFRTGDIVSMHPRGFIQIKDRSKDVIKSGGEWISSVELENKLMGHPAVAEAAVIAMPHEKWSERPLAVVVLKEGQQVTEEQLREHLSGQCAKWWVPDRFEFVEEIPKTAVGKFKKTALRDMFARRDRRSTRGSARRDQLRAVLLRETGGPERLELAEVDEPEPGDGQVLVRVRAAGINFLDVLVRQGRYPQMPELPTVLGSEVAGEVDGRRVMALPRAAGAATPRRSPSTSRCSCRCRTARPSRRARRSC